jgi:hypothetical protein
MVAKEENQPRGDCFGRIATESFVEADKLNVESIRICKIESAD